MLPIQNCHFVKGLDPVADAFSTTVYSDVVNLAEWETATFIIHIGVGATGTSTITVEACDDTVPTNVSALPFVYREVLSGDTPGTLTAATTSGFTATAGSSKLVIVSVRAQQLALSGYNYVRLKAVESVDSAVLGGILIMLSGGHYPKEPNGSAII